MKKFGMLMCCLMVAFASVRAQEVTFEINSGMDDNPGLKSRIEQNMSNLLTEINRAYAAGGELNFNAFKIEREEAQPQLSMLWSNVRFYCDESEIVERIMRRGDFYQVRNIPLDTVPVDTSVTNDNYQEAVIEFDDLGSIVSFYFAISNNLYSQVMRDGKEVADLRRRQQILDYVEHYRTAYNQKDIKYLWDVFSDDAIIITGKTIKTKPTDFNPIPKNRTEYVTNNKREYLTRLKGIFDRSEYIRVQFSEIKVKKHPTKANYYGVLLVQDFSRPNYSDKGYVFLLWDFVDENHPQIHVRTWQDMDTTAPDDVFEITMFDL